MNLKLIVKRFASQISLTNKQGQELYSLSTASPNLNFNWSLAKLFIQAKSVKHNTITSSSKSTNDEAVVVKTAKQVGNVKFTNYLRKMGKIISSGNEVYIETGSVNGKTVNIVSSEKDTLAEVSGLLDKSTGTGDAINVLVLSKGELDVKKFVLYDADAKVALSNTTSFETLRKVFDDIKI